MINFTDDAGRHWDTAEQALEEFVQDLPPLTDDEMEYAFQFTNSKATAEQNLYAIDFGITYSGLRDKFEGYPVPHPVLPLTDEQQVLSMAFDPNEPANFPPEADPTPKSPGRMKPVDGKLEQVLSDEEAYAEEAAYDQIQTRAEAAIALLLMRLMGIEPSDYADQVPNCGNPECPVHGKLNRPDSEDAIIKVTNIPGLS